MIAINLIGCGGNNNTSAKDSIKEVKQDNNVSENANVKDNEEVSYDVMTFGSYNSKPYRWLILDREDGKILLLSKSLIARNPLVITNDVNSNWENCALREWLNNNCLNNIFNENERAQILETVNKNGNDNATTDKIFLLSEEEINQYFKNNKNLQEYFGSEINDFSNWWWLRTFCDDHKFAKYVNSYGYVEDNEVGNTIGIRAAMWISY